jgi:hypothetical protein
MIGMAKDSGLSASLVPPPPVPHPSFSAPPPPLGGS